jgi:hypothetical protein
MADLPENGECEAVLVGDELILRREGKERLNVFEILKQKPVSVPLNRMSKAQEEEDA